MNVALYKNFLSLKKAIIEEKKDMDAVIAVDGYEGTGKSTIAQQVAYFVDSTFNLERICFNPLEFRKAIYKADKFQAIVYDEAFSGLNARQSMGQTNRAIISMLTEIRQKNLFVFILIPSIFDLDKYVALWRTRALIHTYMEKGFKRGSFSFYNQKKKKQLYLKGKKLYQYNLTAPNFRGGFPHQYTVNEQDYRARKSIKLGADSRKLETASKYKLQRDTLLYWIYHKKHLKMSYEKLSKVVTMFSQDNLSGRAVAMSIMELKKQIQEKKELQQDFIKISVDEKEEEEDYPEY